MTQSDWAKSTVSEAVETFLFHTDELHKILFNTWCLFFDPTENAWFEQTLDGEMHRYDNSMARKENEAYQKAIEERRNFYKQKYQKK